MLKHDAAERVIVGLGATGLSVARYLHGLGLPFRVVDRSPAPSGIDELRRLDDSLELHSGELSEAQLAGADQLIVSPGVDPRQAPLQAARARGAELLGDIELFYRAATAPIVAITGTNGKSTVTSLVAAMASADGRRVRSGGNLGTPALDLLDDTADLYVLEVSSFQLQTVIAFRAQVAAFLNLCPDHLDRYDSVADYRAAKLRVHRGAGTVVCNADDPATWPLPDSAARQWRFTGGVPRADEFGVVEYAGARYLARGRERLLAVTELGLLGRHNELNALAALAIGHALGLRHESMLQVLRGFRGLPHRCELVADQDGLRFVNDSKATNVGAAVAAIQGCATRGRIVLIAGGIAKEPDFTPLREALAGRGRLALLLGTAAQSMAEQLEGAVAVERVPDMEAAVRRARQLGEPGDLVLLSPACASFDQFRDFAARGDAFRRAVLGEADSD
jgi:UDP-N-acetylmuramoylalanine--D-glutamate ligase